MSRAPDYPNVETPISWILQLGRWTFGGYDIVGKILIGLLILTIIIAVVSLVGGWIFTKIHDVSRNAEDLTS